MYQFRRNKRFVLLEMDCTIMVGGFNNLLNAIILYESTNSLLEEENSKAQIYNRFKVLLQVNRNIFVLIMIL